MSAICSLVSLGKRSASDVISFKKDGGSLSAPAIAPFQCLAMKSLNDKSRCSFEARSTNSLPYLPSRDRNGLVFFVFGISGRSLCERFGRAAAREDVERRIAGSPAGD